MLGQVDPYQQRREYTCSAAVLHAVLKHWGVDIDEDTLAQLIGVDPTYGATETRVLDTARRIGWQANEIRFASIDDLKKFVDRDVPVIVSVHSFRHPGAFHFVVVTSVDDGGVSLMDPNVAGNRRWLSRSEMEQRWKAGRKGIVITPAQLGDVLPTRTVWPRLGLAAGAIAAAGLAWLCTRMSVGRGMLTTCLVIGTAIAA